MLRAGIISRFSAQYGVSDDQIRRDHLISHILAALPSVFNAKEIHFYGGTALCRTYLLDSRLSEDIDLLSADFETALRELEVKLPRLLRREFPGSTDEIGGQEGTGRQGRLVTRDPIGVQIYVGAAHSEHSAWRFSPCKVSLRYPDLPEHVTLSCPTLETFAAMKLAAYADRHSPRYLFDLAGLAGLGALNDEAESILEMATGVAFSKEEFQRIPTAVATAWRTELLHQVAELPDPEECRLRVLQAIG